MAQSDIWFPLYVGDYLADTMHLDRGEHGAYFLLLLAYYKNQGPLPDDDKTLANIVKETVTVWLCLRSAMTKFFKIEGGRWIHPRADREITRRKYVQAARRQAAANTNAALGRRSVSDTVTVSVSDVQSQSQSQVKRGREFPPHSKNGSTANNGVSDTQKILWQDELKDVRKTIEKLRFRNSDCGWDPADREKIKKKRAREKILMESLGMEI